MISSNGLWGYPCNATFHFGVLMVHTSCNTTCTNSRSTSNTDYCMCKCPPTTDGAKCDGSCMCTTTCPPGEQAASKKGCACWPINSSCSNSCPKGYIMDETNCSCQLTNCPVGWEVAQPTSPASPRRCYKHYNMPHGQTADNWLNSPSGCQAHSTQLATFTTWAKFNAASATCMANKSDPLYDEAGCWTSGMVETVTKDKNGPWCWASLNLNATFLQSSRGLWANGQLSAVWPANHMVEKCVQFLMAGQLNNYPCPGHLSAICMHEKQPCSLVQSCNDDLIQDLVSCACTTNSQPPSTPTSNSPLYLIAGAGGTYQVKSHMNWTNAASTPHDLLYLNLTTYWPWSGTSCVNSHGLFKGDNMAGVKLNKQISAVVCLAGDGDSSWLYHIVKCTTTNVLVLEVGDNWSLDNTHCPITTDDVHNCSKCMLWGRQSNAAANGDYDWHCSSRPALAKAAELTSMVLTNSKVGHVAVANEQGWWHMDLPKSVSCTDLLQLFTATDTSGVVKMAGDTLHAWEHTYSACNDNSSTIMVEPHKWTITPDHCPYLDCSACLPRSSASKCHPSQLAPSNLELTTSKHETMLTWTTRSATTFAVYTTTYHREYRPSHCHMLLWCTLGVDVSISLSLCVLCWAWCQGS